MGAIESPNGEAIQLPQNTEGVPVVADRGAFQNVLLIEEPSDAPILNEHDFQRLVDAMLASTVALTRTTRVAISTPEGDENYYFQLFASGAMGTIRD